MEVEQQGYLVLLTRSLKWLDVSEAEMEMEMEMKTKGDGLLMQGEGVSKRDQKKQTKGGFRRAYLRLDLHLYGYLERCLKVLTSAYELGAKVEIWLRERLFVPKTPKGREMELYREPEWQIA